MNFLYLLEKDRERGGRRRGEEILSWKHWSAFWWKPFDM